MILCFAILAIPLAFIVWWIASDVIYMLNQ